MWGLWEELGGGRVGNEVGEPLRDLWGPVWGHVGPRGAGWGRVGLCEAGWGRVRLGGAVCRAHLCEGCGGGCTVRRLLFVLRHLLALCGL